jgi:hypothetical protein
MNLLSELLKFPGLVDGRDTLPKHKTKQWKRREISDIHGVVFHQSLEEIGTALANAKYHVGPNHISPDGLPGLCYTLFVERDGHPVLANDLEAVTWSQGYAQRPGDENVEFLAVCFGGNMSGAGYKGTQALTPPQKETATILWSCIKKVLGLYNNQLYGHYDFGKPACPGNELQATIENINTKKDWPTPQYNLTSSLGRQEALRELGFYKKEADGVWGPDSKRALVDFQTSAGISPDGLWGKSTTAAVLSALK